MSKKDYVKVTAEVEATYIFIIPKSEIGIFSLEDEIKKSVKDYTTLSVRNKITEELKEDDLRITSSKKE